MISFKTQFDKLTRAYMTTGIDPHNPCFCFVGNLLNNTEEWFDGRGWKPGIINDDKYCVEIAECSIIKESKGLYSVREIVEIEAVFLNTYENTGGSEIAYGWGNPCDQDEHALWIAFVKGIEKLKEIHESKGEVIESCPTLEMRNEPILIPA
jgi:hypothetical protein